MATVSSYLLKFKIFSICHSGDSPLKIFTHLLLTLMSTEADPGDIF